MSQEWIALGKTDKFKENKAKLVKTKELGKLVVVLQNETYYVLSGICTHEEYDLGDAPVQDGEITCFLHMSSFDLKTGEVLSPPADEDLSVYDVKVENSTLFAKKKSQ